MIISSLHHDGGPKTRRGRMDGFSLIELIIVLTIIIILTAMSLPYIYDHSKLYKSEHQALKVMDLMREASQLALNRRRTIRFEIDLTQNAVVLTDENGAGGADILIKRIPLEPVNEVRMDVIPAGVTLPAPPNYADAAFPGDVWAARFRSNGSVVDAGGIPISANLYLWPPLEPGDPLNLTPRNTAEVRAITMFGGSGSIRYWKFVGDAFQPYQ